jgi:hypothetical protein
MAAVLILLVIIVIGAYIWSTYPRPRPQPSALAFSPEFPKSIVPGQSTVGTVHITNGGSDASGVTAIVTSDAVKASSSSVDIKAGATSDIAVTLTGKDVQDGAYAVVVSLQYSDALGSNKTESEGVSIYLLPLLEFTNTRYQRDLFHPFGKSSIGSVNDTTTYLFQVHSKSSAVIYDGAFVTAKLAVTVPGLSISPSSIPVQSLGPDGKSHDYSFIISSNHAPPGTYSFQIALHSKDNQLVTSQTVQIVVAG